jgi:DNA polymerase V
MRLLLGYISAGFPSAAEGYEDEPLNLHTWLIAHPAATFFYRVNGDALRDEYIRDGALLVVDRSVIPVRGNLVVAEEHGCFVVRRFVVGTFIVVGVVVAAITRF